MFLIWDVSDSLWRENFYENKIAYILAANIIKLDIKVNLNKIMMKTDKGVRYNTCSALDDHKESGKQRTGGKIVLCEIRGINHILLKRKCNYILI